MHKALIKNAVIYARYSSDKQTDQSIEGQISVIESFAKNNGYKIINQYVDKAISGRTNDRPSFLKMIEDSENQEFQYVIVYKLDRFSRNRYYSAIYKHMLEENGVRVISATEYINPDSPDGVLFESLLDGYSEYYSKELAQKVRRGNAESRKKGQYTGGACIYGYKIVDKKYKVVKEQTKIVNEIFESVCKGKSLKSIANDLNDRMIKSSNGTPWNHEKIARIIKNKKYIGKAIFGSDVYTNIVPAIVDEKVFDKANLVLKRNSHGSRVSHEKYFLSGKIYCPICGETYIGKSSTYSSGYKYHYYICKNKVKKECNSHQIKKELIEDLVINEIKEILSTDESTLEIASTMYEYYNSSNETNDEIKLLESKVLQDTKKINNLVKSLETYESKTVINRINELEIELKETNERIHSLKKETKEHLNLDEIYEFLYTIKDSTFNNENEREEILKTLVKSVVRYDNYLEVTLYPSNNIKVNFKKNKEEMYLYNNITPQASLRSPNDQT